MDLFRFLAPIALPDVSADRQSAIVARINAMARNVDHTTVDTTSVLEWCHAKVDQMLPNHVSKLDSGSIDTLLAEGVGFRNSFGFTQRIQHVRYGWRQPVEQNCEWPGQEACLKQFAAEKLAGFVA